jgi:hypothetical protein
MQEMIQGYWTTKFSLSAIFITKSTLVNMQRRWGAGLDFDGEPHNGERMADLMIKLDS